MIQLGGGGGEVQEGLYPMESTGLVVTKSQSSVDSKEIPTGLHNNRHSSLSGMGKGCTSLKKLGLSTDYTKPHYKTLWALIVGYLWWGHGSRASLEPTVFFSSYTKHIWCNNQKGTTGQHLGVFTFNHKGLV